MGNLPTLFVATPLHTQQLHLAWVAGALGAMTEFRDRIRIVTQVGSLLPRNRDILTAQFLESPATHMLCIDSDIGWTPAQAQALLDTGKDFVSGTYCKKQTDRGIPAGLNGKREGYLYAAEWVPGGFLLLSRACVERMVGAYREMEYIAKPFGRIWALWAPLFEPGVTYAGEDVAFCNRWRKIGGEIWMHRGVELEHYGEMRYLPNADSRAVMTTDDGPEPAAAPVVSRPSPSSFGPGVELRDIGGVPVHFHPEAAA